VLYLFLIVMVKLYLKSFMITEHLIQRAHKEGKELIWRNHL